VQAAVFMTIYLHLICFSPFYKRLEEKQRIKGKIHGTAGKSFSMQQFSK